MHQPDVDLIDVQADGRMGPSRLAVGSAKLRVTRSCELYGLNLPAIKEARQRLMREVVEMLDVLADMIAAANSPVTPDQVADMQPIPKQCALIREKTKARSPYSKAVRAALRQAGYADLCAKPEEMDDLVAA